MSSTTTSTQQAKGFIAAWLGWAFDGLDSILYTLVAIPFVTLLLGTGATLAMAKEKAALIQGCFMFGWALGGGIFGWIGDRIGRTKTLTLTILIYASFTGLSAFATEWWHLLIFRFIAALGIGGEWAAGSALVSETLPSRHRAWASATLQSGYMVGMILASLTVAGLPSYLVDQGVRANDVHRWVFIVGVLPALVTLWIRKAVPEPEAWQAAKGKEPIPGISALFAPALRWTTIRVTAFVAIALTTVWTFIFFSTQVLRAHPEVASLPKVEIDKLVGQTTIVYLLWNIVGNYCATYTARKFGVRATFAFFMSLAFVISWLGFSSPHTLAETKLYINALAFTGLGIFAIFPLYIPPQFPTLVRTTGAGFCYNFGRVVAGMGTIYGGELSKNLGASKPIAYVGLLYIFGVALALFMPLAHSGASEAVGSA